MNDKSFFGFKEVDKNAKSGLVGEVFTSVASKYDIMNDVMSLGVHRLWKEQLIKEIFPLAQMNILDMAGGTGDIAFRIKAKFPNAQIAVGDINASMLEIGKNNALNRNCFYNITWQIENGEKLGFEDNSFDYYTIAFGIRNFTDIQQGLNEAYRVLKPGGKFICLEFSHVNNKYLSSIYDFYSFKLIPFFGKIIANDEESYNYLVESIRKFPSQDNFKEMILMSGFTNTRYKNLTNGIVAIHTGWKI